jgi:hypothetical protein
MAMTKYLVGHFDQVTPKLQLSHPFPKYDSLYDLITKVFCTDSVFRIAVNNLQLSELSAHQFTNLFITKDLTDKSIINLQKMLQQSLQVLNHLLALKESNDSKKSVYIKKIEPAQSLH